MCNMTAKAVYKNFALQSYVPYKAKKSFSSEEFERRYSYKSLQPQKEPNKTCTAMYVSVLLDKPFWFTIPCNEPIKYPEVDLICESAFERKANGSSLYSKPFFTNGHIVVESISIYSYGCSEGWWRLRTTCVKVFTVPEKAMNANHLCREVDSYTMDIPWPENDSLVLLSFVEAMIKHSNQDIVLQISFNRQCANVFPIARSLSYHKNETFDTWRKEMCSVDLLASHVLCEIGLRNSPEGKSLNPYQKNNFTCLDETLILSSYVCDGHSDCAGAEDEEGHLCQTMCHEAHSGKRLPITTCLYNCSLENCTCNIMAYFQCSQGGCIHLTKLCDHKPDCPNDSSDEYPCLKPQNPVASLCDNGQRIDASIICDGYQNCWDGSDETCSSDSLYNQNSFFVCLNGLHVIPLRFVNDLRPDCPGSDVSDEYIYAGIKNGSVPMVHECNNKQVNIPCVPGHPRCFPYENCVFSSMTCLGKCCSVAMVNIYKVVTIFLALSLS